MKKSLKLLMILALGISLFNIAFASAKTSSFASQNKGLPGDGNVAIYNFTSDSFTIHYYFDYQDIHLSIPLAPAYGYNNPSSDIFTINYPDKAVFFESVVDDQTGENVLSGRFTPGMSIGINPGVNSGFRIVRLK